MQTVKAIYKILRQLEKNMGNEDFRVQEISAQSMRISFEQWEQIMIMLQDAGYIKGINVSKALEDKFRHICEPIIPEITLKGIEYLQENGLMAKAKDALKLAGEFF